MARRFVILLTILTVACTATSPQPLREDEPDGAAAYAAKKRGGAEDVNLAYAKARAKMRRMPRYSTASDVSAFRTSTLGEAETRRLDDPTPRPFDTWKPLGPGNVGGRTRALVIDPVEPRIMYAGGVSGGLWKTYDAGASWQPIGDDLPNLAINALVMHPTDRRTLYAGTGEGYFREEQRGTGLPLRGNGIFVTHDAGETWSQLASTRTPDFHFVNDLVISTHDPRRVYAATRTGVWRSKDSGATWTRALNVTVKGGCLDLADRGDTATDFLFASCGTFEQATVYRATDAAAEGGYWVGVLSEPNMGRTSLAIAPSDPSVVYAMAASNEPGNYNQGLLAVYRSAQNGDAGSWETRVTNRSATYNDTLLLTNLWGATQGVCREGEQNQYVTMGWYSNTLAVDPTNADRVWAGGVDLFRSDDGGATWGIASYWWVRPEVPAFVHADQHAIVFHPQYDGATNKTVYFANDGGLYKTDDALAETVRGDLAPCAADSKIVFQNLNSSYAVTQFYHGAVFPDGRQFIGGTQDNGTVVGDIETGINGWTRVVGGDGGYVAVDPVNPAYVYAESQYARLTRSTNGGKTFRSSFAGLRDEFLFIAPFTLDPSAPQRVWVGGRHVWRSDDRALTWRGVSTALPALVSAIAVAPDNPDLVIGGTDGGHIARTTSGRTANSLTPWSVTQPREGFVSSIAFDPANPSVVYATYAGFGGEHLWRSVDGGATWTALATNLPDIPVHALAIDPTRAGRLYLGTDLGVFVSTDAGTTWSVENTGFAAVVTEAVFIAPGARGPAVYAFTHGRGAWRAELVLPGPKRRAVR